jgi:transposase IS66 family protein
VKTASAPSPLIDRCKIETSGFAAIVVSKFVDHNPLVRQEAIWKRQGMPIARSTMCDMVLRAAELLEPIVAQMRREILAARVLHVVETPIKSRSKDTKVRRLATCGSTSRVTVWPSTLRRVAVVTDRFDS